MSETSWLNADEVSGAPNVALGPPGYDPDTDSGFASLGGAPFSQVLYHLAMVGDPQDLDSSLQNIADHAQMLLQPPNPQPQGLLGDVSQHLAAPSVPPAQAASVDPDDEDDDDQGDQDEADDASPGSDGDDSDQGPVVSAYEPIVQGPLDTQVQQPKYTSLVTGSQLRSIFPQASQRVIDQYVEPINAMFRKQGINTPEQQASFLGQAAVENPTLASREGTRYSTFETANNAHKSVFPTSNSVIGYLNNPTAAANRAYAHYNGNGDEKSGDGYRYRGGGLLQITGRNSYRTAGLEDNPQAVAAPETSANISGDFWARNNLNNASAATMDRKQYDQVTAAVNGRAKLKANERWAAYQKVLKVLSPLRN